MSADHESTEMLALARSLGLPTNIELRGSMDAGSGSQLWSGRDRRRGRDVVVKVVSPELSQRLRAEARALGRLGTHRNIVAAASVGSTADGRSWIVTELAHGGTLASRRGVTSAEVLTWAADLSDALAHAHRMGVVHGDITPTNVFIGGDGRAVLGDFGSAEIDPGDAANGHLGYTPRFAAPERRRGCSATCASDVYGLGATIAAVVTPGWTMISPTAGRLLQRCTSARPARRPSAEQLSKRLSRWRPVL